MQEVTKLTRYTRLCLFMALSTLCLSFMLHPVGEEGVYTIGTLEMAARGEYWTPFLYGGTYNRPPLYNYLCLLGFYIFGPEHVLISARLVSILATAATTLVIYIYSKSLFKNSTLSIYSAACYLGVDILFRRGWIAYADPTFSFLVFLSIASLHIGVLRKNLKLYLLSLMALSGAFFTKALTAYIFYLTAWVFLWLQNHTYIRQRWISILTIAAFMLPFLWGAKTDGAHSQMYLDLIWYWIPENPLNYVWSLATFPFILIARFAPVSLIALLIVCQKVRSMPRDMHLKWLLVFTLFALLPYWISPYHRPRYIQPLYPFLSILFGYILTKYDSKLVQKAVFSSFIGLITSKILISAFIQPFYFSEQHTIYKDAAYQIIQDAQLKQLYAHDDTSLGLCVTHEIDILRWPEKPLERGFEKKEGLYISSVPNRHVVKHYKVGKKDLYLLSSLD